MRKLVIISLFVFAVFIAQGCGEYDPNAEHGEIYVNQEWDVFPNEHLVSEPITIDFWSANSAVDYHGVVTVDLVEKFNEYQRTTYPDSPIRVKPSFQGGYISQNTKLQAAVIAGNNPEIAMVGVSSFSLYYSSVVDMRRIFTYDEIRNIHEGFLQFAMYRKVFAGYPYYAATNIYIVNRTLVDQAGLDIPTAAEIVADPENSTWTWDLFAEYVEKARDVENDIYGAAITGVPLYESFYTQGKAIYNPTCTQSNIDSPEGLYMLEYWQDLVANDYIENPVIDQNHGTRINAEFSSGKIGMIKNSSSISKQIYDNVVLTPQKQGLEPLFELEVLPHPKVTNFYSNQSGGGLIIFNNKSEARQRAAVEFLRWLQADEQSVEFSTKSGYLATTKSATSSEAWKEYAKINPILDQVISLMIFTPPGDLRLPLGRAKASADDEFSKYAREIFFHDYAKSPEQVMQECKDRVDYILRTNS